MSSSSVVREKSSNSDTRQYSFSKGNNPVIRKTSNSRRRLRTVISLSSEGRARSISLIYTIYNERGLLVSETHHLNEIIIRIVSRKGVFCGKRKRIDSEPTLRIIETLTQFTVDLSALAVTKYAQECHVFNTL